MWDITIERFEQEEVPVLKVTGRLDRHTHGLLRGMLDSLLWQGHRSVEIDLGQVTYLDKVGASVLCGVASDLRSQGGRLGFLPEDNELNCEAYVA